METLGALRSTSFGMVASASAGGREYFPVTPSDYLYSQFKYVGGTLSDDGGVPLAKLKILNTIIDQLVTMRRAAGMDSEDIELLGEDASDEAVAEKIVFYQQEVQAMAESMQSPFYGFLMPETGLLVNMQV